MCKLDMATQYRCHMQHCHYLVRVHCRMTCTAWHNVQDTCIVCHHPADSQQMLANKTQLIYFAKSKPVQIVLGVLRSQTVSPTGNPYWEPLLGNAYWEPLLAKIPCPEPLLRTPTGKEPLPGTPTGKPHQESLLGTPTRDPCCGVQGTPEQVPESK